MVTQQDLDNIKLSATKRDFYQLWNQLLETASKLSARWDPTSTNESDPGIVLLKLMASVADQLNYMIDKNSLEAFMPSAAQTESMRKLCDMMGYRMKYYRSATADVTFAYRPATDPNRKLNTNLPQRGVEVPMFTQVYDSDKSVNFYTRERVLLTNDSKAKAVSCMEGQIVRCGADTDYLISLDQLSGDFRYYLPEPQIAENGIYIKNVDDGTESDWWQQVDNLNTQRASSKVWAFGYDSEEGLPYIQFPEDIGTVIEDGLEIWYTRTSGVNGNIAARTITSFDAPSGWASLSDDQDTGGAVSSFSDIANYYATNYSAATNGANEETIDEAYAGFKKTIGTFDTLVTCRDYENAVYKMLGADGYPLVSNIIASDVRTDINGAVQMRRMTRYGQSLTQETKASSEEGGRALTTQDLLLYCFKPSLGSPVTAGEYKATFGITPENLSEIEAGLAEYKTAAHAISYPEALFGKDGIACVKLYLSLDARLSTADKVNAAEQLEILMKVYLALFSEFSMRNLDFGAEVPFDSLLSCIQGADLRIKNVALEEPTLRLAIETLDGGEFDVPATKAGLEALTDRQKKLLNSLMLKHMLSGSVQMFDEDSDFMPSYGESKYDANGALDISGGKPANASAPKAIYP